MGQYPWLPLTLYVKAVARTDGLAEIGAAFPAVTTMARRLHAGGPFTGTIFSRHRETIHTWGSGYYSEKARRDLG